MRVAASRPRSHPAVGGEGRPRPEGARDVLIGLGLLLALALVSVMLGVAVEALGEIVWG